MVNSSFVLEKLSNELDGLASWRRMTRPLMPASRTHERRDHVTEADDLVVGVVSHLSTPVGPCSSKRGRARHVLVDRRYVAPTTMTGGLMTSVMRSLLARCSSLRGTPWSTPTWILCEPRLVGRGRHRLDLEDHQRVVEPAELRALSAEGAGVVHVELTGSSRPAGVAAELNSGT